MDSPVTIYTAKGPHFTSQLFDEFLVTLGVAPRFSTPGHTESMGALERWNRPLKDMINKNNKKMVVIWTYIYLIYCLHIEKYRIVLPECHLFSWCMAGFLPDR